MSKRTRILVVEDDPEIRDEIEDVLATLGFEHDWAASQSEGRELIEANDYDLVLADLEIPARPGRGFAKIEYGRRFIEIVQQVKGRRRVPVIVMTGHHKDALNLAREMLGNGVMEFISKPFGDADRGKSLSQVILNVLERHRRAFPEGMLPGDPPTEFRGGTLAFYDSHIELNGEVLFEADGGLGHAWKVMQALRTPRRNGKLPNLSAPKLANAVDPSGQLTEGAIASCVHDMRVHICDKMLEANVAIGREGVVANKGRGYHLASWLVIENHDGEAGSKGGAGPAQDHGTAMSPRGALDVTARALYGQANGTAKAPHGESDGTASAADGAVSERQAWILSQVGKSVKLERQMVQNEFGIGERQAKRELIVLSRKGLIQFKRRPKPGHYVVAAPGGANQPQMALHERA